VGCGGFHSAVCTEDGKLYTFGGGEHGQLGHNDRVNKLKPTLVQALEDVFVSSVTCGWSHSVALTAKGRGKSFMRKSTFGGAPQFAY
jgi:RCC1 and BTB domain-containing protein